MKTKIFCDTADYKTIKFFNNKSIVDGFTTNPSLMRLAGAKNYKKYSFKISEIDPNVFWLDKKKTWEEKEIHNFLWLNLIDRKNDGKSLQKIIDVWMFKNSKYSSRSN